MARNVTVTVATEKKLASDFPGQTFAGIRISIQGQPEQIVTAPTYAATFKDVPAGTYQITGQAVDTAGGLLGSAVSGTCEVVDLPAPPPSEMVDIPSGISFTLG
jgi:hypothetical protein